MEPATSVDTVSRTTVLAGLPVELWGLIVGHCLESDTQSLSSTCAALRFYARERLKKRWTATRDGVDTFIGRWQKATERCDRHCVCTICPYGTRFHVHRALPLFFILFFVAPREDTLLLYNVYNFLCLQTTVATVMTAMLMMTATTYRRRFLRKDSHYHGQSDPRTPSGCATATNQAPSSPSGSVKRVGVAPSTDPLKRTNSGTVTRLRRST
ncbi:hypothetical protein TW95_gp1388 [Pandoravirus inopinatum]|uniref:F-box domain protein n=1 Tax=Pandoravirus inopinatum TaxID=1605721 RepID=A0A0B5JEC2_9VIRU|nr:hypothetical protein TW95_gp1388 [Pandoravirus inopinatum]AJF98122.1 hypothetical protein [Pandoravirus inopinatum]